MEGLDTAWLVLSGAISALWTWLSSWPFWNWLHSWQTLAGAILGGVFALIVATIVAYDARSRERRSNAYFLITQLKSMESWKESIWTIEDQINQHFENLTKLRRTRTQVADTGFTLDFTLKTLRIRPRLAQLFEQAMGRVMEVDQILAAHLGVFWQAALAAEKLLESEEDELAKSLEWFTREVEADKSPSVTLDFSIYRVQQLEEAVLHGKKSVEFLERLILQRGAFWRRFLRSIYIPRKEKDYLKGLQREQRKKIGP